MFGNGPSHSGFYPKTVGPGTFTLSWVKSFPSGSNPVVIRGDTIYGTTQEGSEGGMYAFAVATADGSTRWKHALPDRYSVYPPAYADGRLYFQRAHGETDTHLWCLDAASGRMLWATPHGNWSERYLAPTIAEGSVFISGGRNGGMYGFNAVSGSQRFFVSLPSRNDWTPSYADGVLYTCMDGTFAAHNPATGLQVWAHTLWHGSASPYGSPWYGASVPAIDNGKAAIIGGGRVVVMDLGSRTQLWSITGNHTGTPAIGGGVVYAIAGKEVKAYDAALGTLLGTYAAGIDLEKQPIVTNDLVIASGVTATYIFDRATFTLRQTLPTGGSISYASGSLCVNKAYYSPIVPGGLSLFSIQPSEEDPAPAPLPPPAPLKTQANPVRTLDNTTAPWIECVRSGGIVYFLFDTPAKLERYELATGTWLAPISLPTGPKAMALSSAGIYVSFGKSISVFSLDGKQETRLVTTLNETRALFEREGKLYLAEEDRKDWLVVDCLTGVPTGATTFEYALNDIVAGKNTANIFASLAFIGRISRTLIKTDGSFGIQTVGTTYEGFPTGPRTFLFPGEDRVVTSGGIVYTTNDLTFAGSLAGSFQDLDFTATGTPVILRDGKLVAYSSNLLETGRLTLSGSPLRIFVQGEEIHSFTRVNGRGIGAVKTALSELAPLPRPGSAVDPTALAYTPDAIEFDGSGTVYLLSKQHKSVFRWSVAERKYLASIPFSEAPQAMAYSAELSRLYLSYSSGRITYLDLASTSLPEIDFVNAPRAPAGLKAIDGLLFVSHASNSSSTQYIHDAAGGLVSFQQWSNNAAEYIWSPSNRRLHYLAGDWSTKMLVSRPVDTAGNIGTEKVHYYSADDHPQHPVRVSPDGARIVTGTGKIYATESLDKTGALANGFNDAAWLGDTLYTVRSVTPLGGSSPVSGELQAWDETDQISASGATVGIPLRLFPLADSLLVISNVSGKIRFARHGLDFTQISSDPGDNPPPPSTGPHPNPSFPLGNTLAKWIDSVQADGIAYFLFDLPAKIERYDLTTETWLEPISLPGIPKAFTVSPNGIFVSFGQNVSAFSLDGATERFLFTAAAEISWLHEAGGKLYVTTGEGLLGLVNSTSGSLISSRSDSSLRLIGLSFCAPKNAIFSRTRYSGSELFRLLLNADGTFGEGRSNGGSGGYPSASRTFVFPNGELVADDAGVVFSTANLWYMGSLAGALDDLAFNGDAPVVLRGNTLIAYDLNFLEMGRKSLSGTPLRLFMSGGNAFTFAMEPGRGVAVTKTRMDGVSPAPTAPVVDPTYLTYTPDQIITGPDDTVLLLSKDHRNVFRWSVSNRAYLTSIPLIDQPLQIAYSGARRRLYVSYSNGRISRIDLDSNSPVEQPFVNLPEAPLAITAAGELLLAVDPTGFDETHYVFSPEGKLLASRNGVEAFGEHVWSAAQQRVYFFQSSQSSTLQSEPITPDGQLGTRKQTPYSNSYTFTPPIRVASDGSVVVVGSGDVYDATSLASLGSLNETITDATWLGEQLFTLRDVGYQRGEILLWTSDASETVPYKRVGKVSVEGTPFRALSSNDQVVVVSDLNGRPRFSVYDTALNRVSIDPEPGTPIPVPDIDPIEWTEVKGVYTGVFSPRTGRAIGRVGSLRFTLTGTGRFTGSIRIGSRTIPIRGSFAEDGSASVSFKFAGETYTAQLLLEMNGSMPVVTGKVETASWTASLEGSRTWHDKELLHPSDGRHTMMLSDTAANFRATVPPIPAVGTVQVRESGMVKLVLIFTNGKRHSMGSWINEDSSLDLFFVTHGGRGHVQGRIWLPVTDGPKQVDSVLHWVKPLEAKARYYPLDISTNLACSISQYYSRAPALDVYDTWPKPNAGAVFVGGDLESPTGQAAYLGENNRILFAKDTEKTTLRLNAATGLVTGSFVHPRLGTRKPITAVIFHAQNAALGYFTGLRSYGIFGFTPPSNN